jgi:hypothetical protein
MKKHGGRIAAQPNEIDNLRKKTAYAGARGFIGVAFSIAGAVLWAGTALVVLDAIASTPFWLLMAGCAAPLVMGLFCFGISALGGAVFDLADCAVNREAREKSRDAQAAYEQYRAQGGQ